MIAITHDDLVVGRGDGIVGPAIPDDLLDLSDDVLRLVDGAVIDASDITSWFIDGDGLKHVAAAAGRQALTCAVSDRLKLIDGLWSVRTVADDLRNYVAAVRWRRENAGANWNGWPIHTDERSIGKYLSELEAIARGVRIDGDPWKFADGVFRPVANADFPELAIAARAHVRTAFGMEDAILAQIEAGSITNQEQIDAAFAA